MLFTDRVHCEADGAKRADCESQNNSEFNQSGKFTYEHWLQELEGEIRGHIHGKHHLVQ